MTPLHMLLFQSGYVEGVEAGKNEGLKEGFGEGFISGLTASSPWASLRGRILYVLCSWSDLINRGIPPLIIVLILYVYFWFFPFINLIIFITMIMQCSERVVPEWKRTQSTDQ